MLSGLVFATPAALWALLALPILFWLLRFTPPKPEAVRFPPFRLLASLVNRQEEARRTPWWLMALRLALAGLLILAAAGPYRDTGAGLVRGASPRLIILDDSWPAAKDWPARLSALEGLLQDAARDGAPVSLALSAPSAGPQDLTPVPAQSLMARAAALKPKALAPERDKLALRLQAEFTRMAPLEVIWLADGLGDAQAFSAALSGLNQGQARVTLLSAPAQVLAISGVKLAEGGFEASISATPGPARDITVTANAANGRVLAEGKATLTGTTASLQLTLPLELRNEAATLRLAGETGAGSVFLLDDRWKRKRVGLISGAGLEASEPLLSPLYYVERALEPFAELAQARQGLQPLLAQGLSMLVLADVGKLAETDAQALEKFVQDGGLLLRFAGPRLAAGSDSLVPVKLRGGRELGGSLAWQSPQPLAAFPEASPFAGLAADAQVRVSRQVLAEPDPELAARSWASLADGTPLVTAQKRGKGLILLFHVTANSDWSDLPLSGLFVEMLRRTLDLAPGLGEAASAPETASAAAAYAPLRALDGFGDLTAMPPEARPIAAADMDKAQPAPETPAGLYTRAGASRALNLTIPPQGLEPLRASADARADFGPAERVHLAGMALATGFLLFLMDTLASLWLGGSLARLRAALPLLMLLALLPQALHAEQPAAMRTTLAYALTGDAQADAASQAGLSGLSRILTQRTAVEPAAPVGVNMERDELVFYPLIYWPVLPDAPELSPAASARLAAYMRAGGVVFFDTRDAAGGTGADSSEALRRILARLDVPALEPVPEGHVLTKSFYILASFPGRFVGANLWVEARASASADNVSAIIIGANDYAGAWAVDAAGSPLYLVTPGGDEQREMAYRVGVNAVMYALTGNYKADQVHVPALLERLGQ